MKCAKCGYVSFDYLSECKRCRTSMTAVRDGFGFMAGKPAVPFLLGSLLSSHEPNMQTDGAALETDTSSPYSFGELDDDGFQMEARETSAAETAPALVNPGRSEEDFSLLDLSDKELELLIDKESAGNGSDRGAMGNRGSELVQAAEPAPSALETSPPRDETPAVAADDRAVDFDDHPHGLDSEPEITTGHYPVSEPAGGARGLKEEPEGPAELKPAPEQAWSAPDDSTSDFVIELSDNDLDSLLEELGSTPKGAA